MRKVGFVIYPGYQPMGLAVTSPFEIANQHATEPVYDIRMLSKDGGPVRTSLGFHALTEPFSEEPYDLIVVCASRMHHPRRSSSSAMRGLIVGGSRLPAMRRLFLRKQGLSTGGVQQPIEFVPPSFVLAIPMCASKRTGSSSLTDRYGLQPG
jgi:hypothetical protein